MPRSLLRFDNVSFSYDSSIEPLLEGICLSLPTGWTGIVGANGAGKTTLLRLALRELSPYRGVVSGPCGGVFCQQRTDDAPEEFAEFLSSLEPEACAIRGRLQLEEDWAERWDSLSHGERKRAQLAVALWSNPPILALDEPTNHLDTKAKRLLLNALRAYDGIGLLVSHDREMLDELCEQCVFVEPPTALQRPGGYSEGAEQAQLEKESIRRERAQADKALKSLRREENTRREQTAKNERQRSKRGVDKKDHDTKARINLAKLTDGGSGQRLRQLEGRILQAEDKKAGLRVQREGPRGVAIPGQRAQGKHLIAISPVELALGPERVLKVPSLVLYPDDRVAIIGPNGAGKSTFIRHLLDSCPLPKSRVAYLAQEIDADSSRQILNEFRKLPPEQLGRAMSLVSRLGSSPQRLLESESPSPGEARKLLLASCIVTEPFLVVLDEPTNHLDLPSIESLEEALQGSQAALLLVSHDRRFLDRLAKTMWEVRPVDGGSELSVVM